MNSNLALKKQKLSYSAILCTFNAEKTIKRALESILNQEERAKEIIIVDDASSDLTSRELRAILPKSKRITFIQNSYNLGQSTSRNLAAAKIATGDILVFFDDDDESLPNRASLHLEMHKHSLISFVSSKKYYRNGLSVLALNRTTSMIPNIYSWARKLILGLEIEELNELWIPSSTMSVEKYFFHLVNGFNPQFRRLEDVDFFLRASRLKPMTSWSEMIGVSRFETTGVDKTRSVNIEFEKMLIESYQNLLSKHETKTAYNLNRLREFYFKSEFIKGFLFLIFRFKSIYNPYRIKRFLNRVILDWKNLK